jgi:hypothetical protein
MKKKAAAKKIRPDVYSSMAQIIPGKTYLIKQNDNAEFKQNYEDKIRSLEEEKKATAEEIKNLEQDYKRLEDEEGALNGQSTDSKKLKRLIPVYRSKRENKEKREELKQTYEKISAHLQKVKRMSENLNLREEIFENLNLDSHKIQEYKERLKHRPDPYMDKKIDFKRLRDIKRGFYLDILESSNNNKLKFDRGERKYDLDRIVENHKQYRNENKIRLQAAAERHRVIQEKQAAKFAAIKILKNEGHYHGNRVRLLPFPQEEDEIDYHQVVKNYNRARAGSAYSQSKAKGNRRVTKPTSKTTTTRKTRENSTRKSDR